MHEAFFDYLFLAEELAALEPELPAAQPFPEIPAPPVPDTISTPFFCRAPEAEMVKIVGSFNDWSPSKAPDMVRHDDGTWSQSVELAPGKHQYKFIVDNCWVVDRNNPDVVDNLYGGKNSIIEVP